MTKLKIELTPAESGVLLTGAIILQEEGLIPIELLDSITQKFQAAFDATK